MYPKVEQKYAAPKLFKIYIECFKAYLLPNKKYTFNRLPDTEQFSDIDNLYFLPVALFVKNIFKQKKNDMSWETKHLCILATH